MDPTNQDTTAAAQASSAAADSQQNGTSPNPEAASALPDNPATELPLSTKAGAVPSENEVEATPDSLHRSEVLGSTLTKNKLNKIMEEFAEFDKSMKIGTRVRKT